MTITMTDVVNAVCDALFTAFGSSYKIYVNQVDQNLQEPCFFIKVLNPSQNQDLGRRYQKQQQISVQYFPSVRGTYSTLESACETLFDCLKDLTISKTTGSVTESKILHGKDLNGQFTDEILTFIVDYGLFILENYSPTDMETLEVDVGAKGQ